MTTGSGDLTKEKRESIDRRGLDRLREEEGRGRRRDRDLRGKAREQEPERARDAIVVASGRVKDGGSEGVRRGKRGVER